MCRACHPQEQPQEDAQEFIQHLLSKLHEELAEVSRSCRSGGGGGEQTGRGGCFGPGGGRTSGCVVHRWRCMHREAQPNTAASTHFTDSTQSAGCCTLQMRKVLKAGGCVSSNKAVPANSSSNASMAAVAKPSGENDDGEEWATVRHGCNAVSFFCSGF